MGALSRVEIVDRIASRVRHWMVGAALGAVVTVGVIPGAAAASGWSTVTRLTTSGPPDVALAVGAFAQPDGRFLLSGYSNFYSSPAGAGSTTGSAGGVFPSPSQPLVAQAVWLPDGRSLVDWLGSVQARAPNGTLVGSPQSIPADALKVDSAGNATAAGVTNDGSYHLFVSTRAFAATSFTEAPTPLMSSAFPSTMTVVGLVVDPDGAAVLTFAAGSTLYQSTRAPGASSPFGAPTQIAANFDGGASQGSNAAGRAVLVYYDGSGYSAAIRSPGGAFGAPVAITGAVTPLPATSVAAVAADGSAAALVSDSAVAPGCGGRFFSLQAYRLAAGATTWTAAGVFGGTDGNSVAHPAIAGGPGGRIDVAWSVDTRSDAALCGKTDSYHIDAGTLGGALLPIYTETPPAYPPPPDPNTYGNGYTGGYAPMMALNSCGDGALIVGIADSVNTDNHDGLFTSTTTGCAATGGKPANTTLPNVSGAAKVGQKLSASTGVWTGTAPLRYAYQWQRCKPGCVNIAGASASSFTPSGADQGAKLRVVVTASNSAGAAAASSPQVGPVAASAPSPAAIKSLLAKILVPSGKLARISALLKHGSYTVSFRAPGRGALSVSWFFVPKGAHLAKAKAKAKATLVASGKTSSHSAGTVKLTVKLTAKGRSLLKHAHRVKLTSKGVYTPSGARGVSTTKSFTLT